MEKQIYFKDNSYFDNIDTEYKAYILGFIYADGCIVSTNAKEGGRQKTLVISIQEEDGYILTKLIQDTRRKDYRIKHSPAQISKGEKAQAIVSITSNQICDNLISLGCNIRKSQIGMLSPKLREDLVQHFIRGFFDGDGGITVDYTKNRYVRKNDWKASNAFTSKMRRRAYFTSTDIIFLENILSYLTVRNKPQWNSKTRVNTCYTLKLESRADVDSLFNYLYKDANYYLKRKFDKFNMTIKSQASTTVEEGLETT